MYQMRDRASYSRIDTEGKLKVYAIVNVMQDCCLFECEEVGRSCMSLKEDARAWLVSSWHIVFKRRPSMGEEFVVRTWPYKFRGVFGSRNFLMESEAGEVLAYADSNWFFFDQKEGKPVIATEEDVAPFGMGEPYPMEHVSRKVKYPKDVEYVDSVRVCENHMDTNEHMNNGEYVRIAADHLPLGYEVEELRVEYRLAAKLGEEIFIYSKQTEEGYFVVMTDKEQSPYAITCFKGKVRKED